MAWLVREIFLYEFGFLIGKLSFSFVWCGGTWRDAKGITEHRKGQVKKGKEKKKKKETSAMEIASEMWGLKNAKRINKQREIEEKIATMEVKVKLWLKGAHVSLK